MIKCPNTGQAISTGIKADRSSYSSTPVFYSSTYCPICRTDHDWFAPQAWVCDASTATHSEMNVEAPVLASWAMRAQRRGRV